MPRIRYTQQFIEDASSIRLASKRIEVRRRIEQLSDFPDIGSPILSASIVERYGPDVRKLVVNPFLVIYEYNRDENAIDVLGLVHQRASW